MQSRYIYIVLLSLLLIIPALLYAFISEQRTPDQHFSYASMQPQNRYIQVMAGHLLVVPFAFAVDTDVSEIRLELADTILQEKGVALEDTVVQVRNGLASSKAVFGFQSKGEIAPGTYYLNILARDNTTGKVVHTGEIPFIVDMTEIVAGCSC